MSLRNYLYWVPFVVLGFELRASYLLGRCSSHSASLFFVLNIFKVRSHKLFAYAGFELPSTIHRPPAF
jgi:hypothetical protein